MIEQDLGQIIPDITATGTVDNTTGTPEVSITVEETEELGKLNNKFKFSFLHLKGEKGDKPQKGVDYYTPQEKEQFTTETKALVTGEGSKQVSLINAETAKVIQQVREIVSGNTATSNALALSGKTRPEFEKDTQGVAGGYNGTFPLTQAVLNGIYLLPATGKFYVCTKEYNGGNLTAPNENFEELSVFKNRDKLENLSSFYDYTYIQELKSFSELRSFKKGSYYIMNLASNEDFFKVLSSRTYVVLRKTCLEVDSTGDSLIEIFLPSRAEYYLGFIQHNNFHKNLIKV